MLKLTFPRRTKSKNIEKAIEMAFSMGADVGDELVVMELESYNLFKAYDNLLPLLAIIGNWKCFKGYWNGAPVNPYRFILKCHFVFECAKDSLTEHQGRSCFRCKQTHLSAHVCPFHPDNDKEADAFVLNPRRSAIGNIGVN
jgi:hypothetical protein